MMTLDDWNSYVEQAGKENKSRTLIESVLLLDNTEIYSFYKINQNVSRNILVPTDSYRLCRIYMLSMRWNHLHLIWYVHCRLSEHTVHHLRYQHLWISSIQCYNLFQPHHLLCTSKSDLSAGCHGHQSSSCGPPCRNWILSELYRSWNTEILNWITILVWYFFGVLNYTNRNSQIYFSFWLTILYYTIN